MNKFAPLLLVAGLAMLAPALHAGSILPAKTAELKLMGSPQHFNATQLYNLVDGEADAILQYHFAHCWQASYARAGSTRTIVTATVFDMTAPLEAYGVFGSDRQSGRPLHLGAEAVQIGNSGLDFWKGRYVVRLALVQRASPIILNHLASSIVRLIPGTAALPREVKVIPAGAVPGSARYVRANYAGQSFLSHVVAARYRAAGPQSELFVARYSSAAAAQSALRTYSRRAQGNAPHPMKIGNATGFSARDPYSGPYCVVLHKTMLVGVLRVQRAAAANQLIAQTLRRL